MSKQSIRREKIALLLMKSNTPVPGKDLSRVFGVSRQVIVSDIAALKAEGHDIISAHNGYILGNAHRAERVFKIRHTSAETEDELTTIVSLGGVVVDVYVWHRVYGRITANLSIATMEDVTTFIENIKSGKSSELMHVTGGYHYHTIRADSENTLNRIEEVLKQKNYIVPEI